jgi:hypothetical protein
MVTLSYASLIYIARCSAEIGEFAPGYGRTRTDRAQETSQLVRRAFPVLSVCVYACAGRLFAGEGSIRVHKHYNQLTDGVHRDFREICLTNETAQPSETAQRRRCATASTHPWQICPPPRLIRLEERVSDECVRKIPEMTVTCSSADASAAGPWIGRRRLGYVRQGPPARRANLEPEPVLLYEA